MAEPGVVEAFDVIVVGGGIVGAAILEAVSRRGRKALLLEQHDPSSGVTGASLACIGVHAGDAGEGDLLAWSRAAWSEIAGAADSDIGYRQCGQLRFIDRAEHCAAAAVWVAKERARGRPLEFVPAERIRAIEPAMTGPVLAAVWSPEDAVVNPFLAVRGLLSAARRAGAEVRSRTPVEAVVAKAGRVKGVRIPGGEVSAGAVVLASGPWTAALARSAGVEVPIASRRAQCLATVAEPPIVRGVVSAFRADGDIDEDYTQIQQAADGQILFNTVFANPAQDVSLDRIREVDRGFIARSIGTLLHLFPVLDKVALLRSWSRCEAVTPDDRFIVGPIGPDGLFVAAGDNGSGFNRAPAIGRMVGEALDGAAPSAWALLYDPLRFAGAETVP